MLESSDRSDDTEIIEVVEDSENDEDRAAEGEGDDDAAPTKITDVSAFRAASEDVVELLKDLGSMEMGLAEGIIQAKLKTVAEVHAHFECAMSCRVLFEKVETVLRKRDITSANTIFAHSLCPDEVPTRIQLQGGGEQQHYDKSLKRLFSRHFGEAFPLGGLCGIPFAGKTGFASFSHNVPDDGHAFLLMAPHIGLDCENKFGKCTTLDDVTRSNSEYCCRAAVTALNYCCSARPLAKNLTDHPEDYQMNYMTQLVDRRKDLFADESDENTRMSDLAKNMHAIAKNMLDKIVNPFFGGPESTLVILTGIQINMPKPFEDFFQPRQFYVLKKDGKKEDLFRETFGTQR